MSVHTFLAQLFPNEGLRVFVTNQLLAPPTRKIYILCGNGANGKSTFMNFAKQVCICSTHTAEDQDAFWAEIGDNLDRPIYMHVHNLGELDFLDSSDLWDRVCIIPMTSQFVEADGVDEKSQKYLAIPGLDITQFAKEFLDEYSH